MAVSSLAFLGFLLIASCVYYVAPARFRWIVLLFASAVFYLSYDARMMAVVFLNAALTYVAGRSIEKISDVRLRRAAFAFSLIVNFAPLAAFKYLGLSFGFVPLGISFYTMQAASYIVDIYSEKYPPEHNFPKFLLYITFFPQVVQGPINRWDALGKQLFEEHKFDPENIRSGLQLITWGMLKKTLVADTLRIFVDNVFAGYSSLEGAVIFTAVALYCVQLYADFSGGIDVARGAAKLFGITMAQNFRQPYFATSIDDFWRRWHISLGEWMRDYVFYPLALSRPFGKIGRWARRVLGREIGKALPIALATIVTFLAVGVWQGPGWSNVAYGLWNGGLMSLALLFRPLVRKIDDAVGKHGVPWRVFNIARTSFLVCVGRYFSRGETFLKSVAMLRQTADFGAASQLSDGTLGALGLTVPVLTMVVPMCAAWLAVSVMKERDISPSAYLNEKPALFQFALLFAGLAALIVTAYIDPMYVAPDFIYEGLNR